MINKTLVILANSVKNHEHCVAGKCIVTKQWIRPVSSPEGGALTNDQSTYKNKYGDYIVKPKQKIEMNLSLAVPLINQPENHLISGIQWQQRFKITDNELASFLDYPDTLWGTENSVKYEDIVQSRIVINQSLYLIQVEDLKLHLNSFNKRRAKFTYNRTTYVLPVTDPTFHQKLLDPSEILGVLCISLAGVHTDGSCYKLVATIF